MPGKFESLVAHHFWRRPCDANGVVEAIWNTPSPNKKGQGGNAIGGYTATTTGVTASGFVWDQIPTGTTFTIGQ